MEKITVHIRPLDWTEGNVYWMSFKLTGENPAVIINWGDGIVKTYYGQTIYTSHIYPKDKTLSFVVTAVVSSGQIDYCDPTGGDCNQEFVDFSEAPSIKEIDCEMFEKVIFGNPNLEILNLRNSLDSDYDLSKLPNLKEFRFDCVNKEMKCLDLSHCHRIEHIQCWCYSSPKLQLVLPDDAPLNYIDISGHNFHKEVLDSIHRIIERNGGEIYDGLHAWDKALEVMVESWNWILGRKPEIIDGGWEFVPEKIYYGLHLFAEYLPEMQND
ncbi:MAG: leucine-rich repeat domain-containing protein [Lachnospiraceae bacterium]|nr:leucine-rich repeat domain-containing protein [Lachnospiraceae bacterium]